MLQINAQFFLFARHLQQFALRCIRTAGNFDASHGSHLAEQSELLVLECGDFGLLRLQLEGKFPIVRRKRFDFASLPRIDRKGNENSPSRRSICFSNKTHFSLASAEACCAVWRLDRVTSSSFCSESTCDQHSASQRVLRFAIAIAWLRMTAFAPAVIDIPRISAGNFARSKRL